MGFSAGNFFFNWRLYEMCDFPLGSEIRMDPNEAEETRREVELELRVTPSPRSATPPQGQFHSE